MQQLITSYLIYGQCPPVLSPDLTLVHFMHPVTQNTIVTNECDGLNVLECNPAAAAQPFSLCGLVASRARPLLISAVKGRGSTYTGSQLWCEWSETGHECSKEHLDTARGILRHGEHGTAVLGPYY